MDEWWIHSKCNSHRLVFTYCPYSLHPPTTPEIQFLLVEFDIGKHSIIIITTQINLMPLYKDYFNIYTLCSGV